MVITFCRAPRARCLRRASNQVRNSTEALRYARETSILTAARSASWRHAPQTPERYYRRSTISLISRQPAGIMILTSNPRGELPRQFSAYESMSWYVGLCSTPYLIGLLEGDRDVTSVRSQDNSARRPASQQADFVVKHSLSKRF